ncbi:B-cadherin-like [Engraulis encrasicolus]|uniref:B-cadherin-like n=1 Tax=Engraulis encrasicolus TaxID=184585 RepID=UPI002FD3D123
MTRLEWSMFLALFLQGLILTLCKENQSVHMPHGNSTQNHIGCHTKERCMVKRKIPDFPVLQFQAFQKGLVRRRRDWIIPPISISENDRGPFPKSVVQIKSSWAREMAIRYQLSGPGADQPPEGLFTIEKRTGMLFITKPLDREHTQEYRLIAHALLVGTEMDRAAEAPMEIVIKVLDQNDNRPTCTRDLFQGNVSEVAPVGEPVLQVTAEDRDDPRTENAMVRYSIVQQQPAQPNPEMFSINEVSGLVSVASVGLDSEGQQRYNLLVEAADMEGNGMRTTCTATISITDSNDNAPKFSHVTYTGSIPENVVGGVVVQLPVTDRDQPLSPASATTYSIVKGNDRGLFSISTGPSKMEGIITTAQGLDFEEKRRHTLLVVVENEVPFAMPLPTSTATVVIDVEDVNEAPEFVPSQKRVQVAEDTSVGTVIASYKAKDPDVARKQEVTYEVLSDPAGWLEVGDKTGLVRLRAEMDREHGLVEESGKYTALIVAYDNDMTPASGTGTLVIEVGDVNDNAPLVKEKHVQFCSLDPVPVPLTILDADGPDNAGPFTVQLAEDSRTNWTTITNSSSDEVSVRPRRQLPYGEYTMVLRVYDAHMMVQDSPLVAEVCQCSGPVISCFHPAPRYTADSAALSLGVLGTIFLLLVLLLLLSLFMTRRKRRMREKQKGLLPEEAVRDTLFFYNEEGGGEDDQEYDLSQLHCGLDEHREVGCTDVAPALLPPLPYRLRPEENEEISTFIMDNLKAADNDPTAAPFDGLLVFDYEGEESTSGSLSSLQWSSSDGEQDHHQQLQQWGPRFRRLADMYHRGSIYRGADCNDNDDEIRPGRQEWV